MRLLVPLLALCTAPLFAESIFLFDGKSLEGWEGDAKWWRVEDGLITGGSLENKVDRNHFLATKTSYQNFDLTLKIKITGSEGFINSGVQIRSVRVPSSTEMSGYQVDAGDGWWGKIYDESRRNKVVGEAKDLKAVNAAVKKGDWNEYRIRAEGGRIQSWVNGVPALDYTEADANIAQDGLIGIQVHGGGKALVQVKEIKIEELPPTANAPTWEKLGRPGDKKPSAAKPMKEGNTTAGPRSPEEERASFHLPDGLEMELVASEDPAAGIGKFIAVYFDPRGAMWTMTALEYPVDGNENKAAADALYQSKARDKILVYERDSKSPTGFAQKPRVFADGLAIPLGILPYKDGCYVQHGHDIALLRDTDGDGRADKREVILTGFGVQDSHLFPHQFTRGPGGWMWLAQGAFNAGKVSRPGESPEKAIQFDQTRMAKFRPDGSRFTITSNGPCNIWGLVLNGEGESFIQEANDFGYPVMPFHEYANYPGCSNRQWKSYAPEFPGTAPDFRMGGTGLSGLALTDKNGVFPEAWRDIMLVANPITNKVQGIQMKRDGTRWALEKPQDVVSTDDSWFRPVALTLGPDGCVYVVDWYNKIISHNEVPRTHPDRDKNRGRIWRIKPKGQSVAAAPDFSKFSGEELLTKLGSPSLAQHHLAWQTIADRELKDLTPQLTAIVKDPAASASRRIGALWALEAMGEKLNPEIWKPLFTDANRNIRREAARAAEPYISSENGDTDTGHAFFSALQKGEPDPEVRAEMIRSLGSRLGDGINVSKLRDFFSFALAPLESPTAPSTHNGKPIKVREAYEREFERYLVRMFLEANPSAAEKYLNLDGDKPVEAQLLAALALEPKASATRVAALLPKLERPPQKEEVLRLVQFLEAPGVTGALEASLANTATAPAVLASLLELRARLDASKIAPIVTRATSDLLASKDRKQFATGVQLAGAFKITTAEAALVTALEKGITESTDTIAGEVGHRTWLTLSPAAVDALKALRDLQSDRVDLFERLIVFSQQPEVRDEALSALAASRSSDAPQRIIKLGAKLGTSQRRSALDKLSTTKAGANTVVAAVTSGTLAKADLDAALLDRLLAVLGDKNAELNALVESVGSLFRPVLSLDGDDNAFTETGVNLEGPLTVETWVKLEPGITNADGIFGSPAQIDLNFYDGKFRVWAGQAIGDVAVTKKRMVPGMWTHVAASRNVEGIWKLYIDGELDAIGTKRAAHPLEQVKIGWTNGTGGTRGQLAEFRIWSRERSATDIRAAFDRGFADGTPGLVWNASGRSGWGKLLPGAKILKLSDLPPVLTAEAASKLDTDFAKFSVLADKTGDASRGKIYAAVCRACHLMGAEGGQIGPNLSGVGAMGTEAILRNILTPNAAMESAYRIYRVEKKDGAVLDAFFVNEDNDAVVIRLPGGIDQRVKKSEIRETKFLRRSLMPEGLLEGMSPEQVTDLFSYLKSLR